MKKKYLIFKNKTWVSHEENIESAALFCWWWISEITSTWLNKLKRGSVTLMWTKVNPLMRLDGDWRPVFDWLLVIAWRLTTKLESSKLWGWTQHSGYGICLEGPRPCFHSLTPQIIFWTSLGVTVELNSSVA